MQKIVDVHFPGLKKALLREALEVFFELREIPGLKKKPSTSELHRLAEAAAGRGYPARSAAQQGPEEGASAACMAPC